MKNLGNIFFIIFLIPCALYGGVVAGVDSKKISQGDMVTYSLDLSGEDITRPNIYNLCGSDVISSGSSTNIRYENGEYKKSYVLSYKFMPKQSCTIESIEVEIDGKKEKTEPIEIIVSKELPSKDADFSLTLSASKKEVFVGEPFELTLLLRQKNSAEAVDSKFIAPPLKGFWIKGETSPVRNTDGNYTTTTITYTMAPQREGKLDISSAQMRIASRSHTKDSWGGFIPQIKWKSYFSNELSIVAKPLPEGVSLVGDFSIDAKTQSVDVNANEALNVTVNVIGKGNLEDIKTFKPYIDGVSVFDEKIEVKNGVLTQKIAFVADANYTIPSFSLRYFDPIGKEIKTVSTKPIDIKVKNAKPKQELNIKRNEKKAEVTAVETLKNGFDVLWVGIGFAAGALVTIVIMLIKPFRVFERGKKLNIKDEKMLLIKLLPYKDDEDVEKIIEILEHNIYSNDKKQIDKKVLNECIKKYKIS